MSRALEMASRITSLPGLNLLSRAANRPPTAEALERYLACQRLAQEAAREIAGHIREGWDERQAASLLDTYLRDCGVRSFFHQSFVWFGERTRFDGVRTYWDYLPTSRVIRPGEPFILDVAPILDGYICDIGHTGSLGEHAGVAAAKAFLADLRLDLPGMFAAARSSGGAIWREIDDRLNKAGYDNVHAQYPFSVLGHRVHRVRSDKPWFSFINFGWQSYWEFLSRGLFGQLLNQDFSGDLRGLWAIEPHLGTRGKDGFGAKFEEILVVDGDGARWLE